MGDLVFIFHKENASTYSGGRWMCGLFLQLEFEIYFTVGNELIAGDRFCVHHLSSDNLPKRFYKFNLTLIHIIIGHFTHYHDVAIFSWSSTISGLYITTPVCVALIVSVFCNKTILYMAVSVQVLETLFDQFVY